MGRGQVKGAVLLEDDGAGPGVHGGVEGAVVHAAELADVAQNVGIVGALVVPGADGFVLGVDVGDEGASIGGLLVGVDGLEAAPSGEGSLDGAGRSRAALVHADAGPDRHVVFGSGAPGPHGGGGLGVVALDVGGEADPVGLVDLGADEC